MIPPRTTISTAVLMLLCAAPLRAEVVEGVAAIVGDDVILISELNRSSRRVIQSIEQREGRLPREALLRIRKDALESLIDERLIREVATRLNMVAEPEEIDQAIAGIAAEEGVSVEDIYSSATSAGLDRERYRQELGGQITRMRVISGSVRTRVTVTPEEVQALYEERYGKLAAGLRVRMRHILLPWPSPEDEITREEVVKMAGALRERALAGEDFARLAKRFSAAPTAARGGLTVIRENEAPEELRGQVFVLAEKEISPVIENEHGVNLFQRLDSFDPSDTKFEDVKEALKGELIERKTAPEFESWLQELRHERYIEIVLPELR